MKCTTPRRKRTTVGRTLLLGAVCDRPRSPLRCSVGRTAALVRASELGHNIGACAPSRMTPPNPPLFWIASLSRRRASTRPVHEFDVHSVAGRPVRKTTGLVAADTNGTALIREECAQPACTSGLKLSASLAADGRRVRIGMLNVPVRGDAEDCLRLRQLCSDCRPLLSVRVSEQGVHRIPVPEED